MNKTLSYAVTGQRIETTETAMLVAGTVNIYTARFAFGAEWDGLQRTAVFAVDGITREQLLEDDACTVPWEVLVAGNRLRVGVYGTKADGTRLPTIWTERRLYINPGAGPTQEAADPSPTLVEQLLGRIGDPANLKTEDKSSLVAAINEVQETGGGGTADHAKLKNRDAAGQHPMSAITGLVDALSGKQPTGNYLTEEMDPTVPEWAKQPQKPAYTAQEVGALPATTHIPSTADDVNAEPSGAVSQHNVSDSAHSDIRLLIQGLTDRLNALADSDDTTLDQMSEIVAYIKSNKSLIDAISTSKVNVADIVDNLTTNAANKPLSAAQGVALKALIDAITVPDKLPNPNALTFTGAVTGSYDGSAPLSVEIPSGGGSGSDISLGLTGATVGQIAKITAVDDTGKPTAWSTVDMPSVGGHWETVLDTVWEQDVINPTAYDSGTGIFTCAEGELNNLELNKEYVFFQQCAKEGVAYNTILNNENLKVTKLSDTTFSIDATPPATFVPTNVKFSKGSCLAITDIDAKKIRLTLDGQFKPTATLYDRPFYGMNAHYFGQNTGYQQIRNAYQAYQQVTAEVESPYRIVGKILCGFNAPSSNANFHFKNNSFCCPLVPAEFSGSNTYILTSDGTKIDKLYSTSYPWHLGGGSNNTAISSDYIKIISGTKVKLDRWVE